MTAAMTTSSSDALRIAFVGPARYPVREPYAGGLEAFCHTMVSALRSLGHHVDFFAAAGSDGNDPALELPGVDWGHDLEAATDTTYPEGGKEREDQAFIQLRHLLARRGYDVVHNNSLNPLMFPGEHCAAPLPMLTTLHTPCVEEIQDAITAAGTLAGRFAAVSHTTAADWVLPTPATVVPNGINVSKWTPGDGGERAVWFGRLVPEKGAHLAMDACREAGIELVLAGRNGDLRYVREEIEPRLAPGIATWAGEMSHAELRDLVASSAVAVVSPRWEEPFGLVAFEAMACGTPVAAFERGGLGELLRKAPAALAEPDNTPSLAAAIRRARTIDRTSVREWVVTNHSLTQTARTYVTLYRTIAQEATA